MATKAPKMPRRHDYRLEEKLATPVKPGKRILTPKQWKFVQELVMGDGQVTMAEAAIRAGWPPKTAKEAARVLTSPDKSPHVVAAIQELRKDMAERFGTTMERHMRDLQLIRDLALQAGAYGAAVQAEFRRGQALGTIYIDRKEIRHGTIDSMSKEEVERKLEEIKRLYGDPGKVIDITPQEIQQEPQVPQKKPFIPHVDRPSSPEGKILRQATVGKKKKDVPEAREQALSEIEGKPVRLPYYPD